MPLLNSTRVGSRYGKPTAIGLYINCHNNYKRLPTFMQILISTQEALILCSAESDAKHKPERVHQHWQRGGRCTCTCAQSGQHAFPRRCGRTGSTRHAYLPPRVQGNLDLALNNFAPRYIFDIDSLLYSNLISPSNHSNNRCYIKSACHLVQTDTHRLQAPFGTCIPADSARPGSDVYTQLYPVKYDHVVSDMRHFQPL